LIFNTVAYSALSALLANDVSSNASALLKHIVARAVLVSFFSRR